MLTIEEAIEELESGGEIEMESDYASYTIGPADSFVGGEAQKGYISEVLGNIIYESAERIVRESYNYLSANYNNIIITF